MLKPPWLDDALAANGLPVQENFRAWFRASQAVDEQGLPLRLYHGTPAEFDRFHDSDKGLYFTEHPQTAQAYALGWDGSEEAPCGAVLPVWLSLQRPLRVDREFLERFVHEHHDEAEVHRRRAGSATFLPDAFESSEEWARNLVRREARRRRCDGMLIEHDMLPLSCLDGDWDFQRSFVVFSPSQVKSAISNSGLFLPHCCSLTDQEDALALRHAQRARAEIRSPGWRGAAAAF